jgi:ABC-2 type transport system ATP-binding protein
MTYEQPPGSAAIEVAGVTKHFARTTALSGVSFTANTGAVTALLGPNGAGKTTMIRILSTLLRPDSGTARVGGHDSAREPELVQAIIGLTGQSLAVDGKLSGPENLTMFGRLHRLPWSLVRQRSDRLLRVFGLSEAGNKAVQTYSGGMRRKLDLAVSLMAEPPVLFLDEPTTGLDPASRDALWDIIRDLVRQGTTVLLTTQYLNEADALADRITFIDGGRVVALGTPAELKARAGGRYAEFVLTSPDQAGQLADWLAASGATADDNRVRVAIGDRPADLGRLILAIEEADLEPVDYQVRTPSLDDVYFALAGHSRAEPEAIPLEAAR